MTSCVLEFGSNACGCVQRLFYKLVNSTHSGVQRHNNRVIKSPLLSSSRPVEQRSSDKVRSYEGHNHRPWWINLGHRWKAMGVKGVKRKVKSPAYCEHMIWKTHVSTWTWACLELDRSFGKTSIKMKLKRKSA